MSADSLDQAVAAFLAVRDRLFCIAYRILNDCTEAEDIVQDAWLRWQVCDRKAVVDPMAYLATTTRRLCLNSLQSARARRETCLGPWLAERVDPGADPLLGVERGEELEHATRRLLERLSPTERAAYVLREAFDYSYAEVAAVVCVTEGNARQLVSRARRHLAGEGRETPSGAEQKRLLGALSAAQSGDLATLENVFTEDVALAA
ncbi:sigma-70 family RNA polymerase sigma factor [Mycobacterium sp. URHB0021]|jgi:RNA polymerase sigma-70 factor, ECF subfamily